MYMLIIISIIVIVIIIITINIIRTYCRRAEPQVRFKKMAEV